MGGFKNYLPDVLRAAPSSHRMFRISSRAVAVALVSVAIVSGVPAPADAAPPAAPTGLAAVIDWGRVALSWTAVGGATSYNIYRATTSGGETLFATGVTQNLSYSDGSAVNNTAYYFEVSAVSAGVEGPLSTEVTATPLSDYSTSGYHIRAGTGAAAAPFAGEIFESGGIASSTGSAVDLSAVNNAAPQTVYRFERFGTISFTLPGLKVGAQYIVRLHFAELHWTAVGQRTFNVSINGTQVLTNFDIFAATGGRYKAVGREFYATASGSGKVVVAFTTVVDQAKIDAVELFSLTPAVTLSLTALPAAPVPGNDITYAVNFSNTGYFPALNNAVALPVPVQTCLKVGSPTSSLGSTGLTQAVSYSNDHGATFTYTPVSGACGSAPTGYDAAVTNVLWTFSGSLSATTPANSGSVSIITRVK